MSDFSWTKSQFHLPVGVIYLDGNSLGPLPIKAMQNMQNVMQNEWGALLIKGWNEAGWMAQPAQLGDQIARLIGAPKHCVTLGDTLSIKVFQALDAALKLTDRRVILSDTGNFPSDLYMAEGLAKLRQDCHLRTLPPEQIESALSDEIGVLMLTEVDYRTGRRHNIKRLTQMAHERGILTLWDLAHSAGATDLNIGKDNVDFAVGCTYKYLNAGPGAPAFIYAAPRHAAYIDPALCGWLGHKSPFDFAPDYTPAAGVSRFRIGTPPVLQMAALESALEIWAQVDMQEVRQRSIELSTLFIKEMGRNCPQLVLASPEDPHQRGSQVSFHFEHGYAAMQACIAQGVIGDFRAPDIMRFGITPLYIDEKDIQKAAHIIADVMARRLWNRPEYRTRKAVT